MQCCGVLPQLPVALNQLMLPQVSTLTAAELVEGSWTAAAALLVMPGGADLPYCNRLNGKGNSIIQGAAAPQHWRCYHLYHAVQQCQVHIRAARFASSSDSP